MNLTQVLSKLFAEKSQVSWEEIVAAVRSSGIKIPKKGWMRVRRTLQLFITAGKVARTDDLHSEVYEVRGNG